MTVPVTLACYDPVKTPKKARKKETITVLLLCCEGKIALRQRGAKTVLAGLWEFPNLDGHLTAAQVETAVAPWDLAIVSIQKGRQKKHLFTHIEWDMTSYLIDCGNMSARFLWVTPEKLRTELTLPSAFQPFIPMAGSAANDEAERR